ncbi:SH3 domain-containing protein [Streptomyces sp. 840.1]|uniref:SH3 domain-containing protein n=1 Tax=Streptomyces sp. 840.1 TaxID=2485152 RepID=UPI000F492F24|nr:SH3 domain-containing protein [Streptomyces sp. 840.1]ROQ70192.1 SH3 domain-containing protein [Streptomyces sp. 840.1]
MRIHRVATAAAVCAAVALPAVTATAAHAAVPGTVAVSTSCHKTGPYEMHGTSAVTIRSKASSNSTAVGVLYRRHKFTVHKKTKTGSWVHITDKKTGVAGWVSGTYVYRTVYMCLD